tara:strand:- start:667 stop:1383 length:717 start_codon:yes stop_codon:yes gene_type:complete
MSKPRKNIDLVIPFNNEYSNLQILIPQISKTIKKIKDFNFKLIFIDDGSSDDSFLLVKKYQRKNKNIKILRNIKKKGQTYCYKSYLNTFHNIFFIRMDADNQDDPKHLIKMVKLISKGYDMILTDRKIRKHSIYMIFLTYIYDLLISVLIGKKLSTYSSSLACFNIKYLFKKGLRYNDHRYFPIIAIHNKVKKIKVFPVMHKSRLYGHTKYGMIRKIIFALPEFLYFYYRLKRGLFKN